MCQRERHRRLLLARERERFLQRLLVLRGDALRQVRRGPGRFGWPPAQEAPQHLSPDQRNELEEHDVRCRPQRHLVVELLDLAVVDEQQDVAALERPPCRGGLLVGVDLARPLEPIAVELALCVGGLHQPDEAVVRGQLRVEGAHLLMHPCPDQVPTGRALGLELEIERAEHVARGRFVTDLDGERHWTIQTEIRSPANAGSRLVQVPAEARSATRCRPASASRRASSRGGSAGIRRCSAQRPANARAWRRGTRRSGERLLAVLARRRARRAARGRRRRRSRTPCGSPRPRAGSSGRRCRRRRRRRPRPPGAAGAGTSCPGSGRAGTSTRGGERRASAP